MRRKFLGLTCHMLLILLWATSVSASGAQATIKRDNYGVPHVYSDTLKGLFFGYGYAVAQDRLYQIEIFRRTYWGRLSEVYGEGLLAFDQANRRDNLTLPEIKRQIKTLNPELQNALKAFSAGINKYVTEALADRTNKLPKEFHHFDFNPEPWNPEDVAANFLSVMGFFMDVSAELANASMLKYLKKHYGTEKAKNIFDDWCWGYDPESPTTIKPANILRPDKKAFENDSRSDEVHWKHPLMKDALKASSEAESALAKERLGRYSLVARNFPYSHPTSYAAVMSPKKSATGRAMLLGGPQFDFQIPSVCYEVGLHGAGIDCVGTAIAGYPFIMFGHNRRAAFTSTAGIDNIEDIFAEKLNPDDHRQYWFNDEWRKMKARVETFRVKGRNEPISKEFFCTVHGPVFYIDKENNVAFSKKLSCREGFLQGLASFYELMKAETVAEFNKAAQLSDMSVNYFFANVGGDIAYYHLGLYPVRAKGVDVRLPTPGTGEFEWKAYRPKSRNPHVANPPQGYFVNQNEQPEPGWSHGDMATTDMWGGWGADNRVSILIKLAESKNKLDQKAFKDIIKTICFYDLRAMNIKTLFLEAARGVSSRSPDIERALELLTQWNNQHIDHDQDGFYDHAGSAIFDRWWKKAVPATFEDWFPGYRNSLGKSAVDILNNRYMGYTLFYRLLKGKTNIDYFKGKKAEILYTALQLALKDLADESPGKTVADYRKKIVTDKYSPVTVLGHFLNQPIISSLTSAKEQPSFPTSPGHSHNRGAVNHIVTLTPDKIVGENITSPGNSGFVSADGTKSLHCFDQVKMFVDFSYKPMLFTEAQVNAAVETTQVVEWR